MTRSNWAAAVYDGIQHIAGGRHLQERLAKHLAALTPGSVVLDVGGGTGLIAPALRGCQYLCLDLDLDQLRGFKARVPGGSGIAADATRTPIATARVDVVLCTKVTHHLDDRQLAAMLEESARMLRAGGMLLLADAVASERLMSRLLWAVDRGSHPRSLPRLSGFLSTLYRTVHEERFRLGSFHDFWLCVAHRKFT